MSVSMETRQERAERFIRIWNSSGSLQQVADQFGGDRQNVSQYAAALRKSGIQLRPLKMGRPKKHDNLDVAQLNRIAADVAKQPPSE